MPLPTPTQDENRAEFISRCMSNSVMRTEFPDNNQRLAICGSQFDQSRERTMSVNDKLLAAIKARLQKLTEFGFGILTADCWVKTLQEEVGLDLCYRYAANKQTSFNDLLRKAANTLVYSNSDMEVEEIEYSKQTGSEIKKLSKDIELPKNTLMVFRHTLTSPKKDRDGDILRTQGATVDPKMLLLWQHVHTLPIGKMLKVAKHNTKRLSLVSAIVDVNELCHDAAVMIDNDMGRFSHGFRAIDFEEMGGKDAEGGFDIKEFEIMEASLVSVPSNTDAETEEVLLSLVEGGKLNSPLMKEYGKGIRSRKDHHIPVTVDLKLLINGKEVDDENVESKSGEKGSEASTSKEANGKEKEDETTKDTEVKEKEDDSKKIDGEKTPESITVKQAMEVVLACATKEQRNKMMEALETMKLADSQHQKVKQYRTFVGT